MTATSTTIPPALKDMPAHLGDKKDTVYSSLELQMLGFRYGFDPSFLKIQIQIKPGFSGFL